MYEKPELEIIKFLLNTDVITASSVGTQTEGDSNGWIDGGELD